MPPRLRKLVGSVAVLAFLATYIAVAVTLADRLPDNRLVQLVYFVVVGTAWGLPLFPLIAWMQRGR
jgi:Protein of unknown function (DUF2842)